jgi:CheY-like chemotaxis protein
MSSDSGNRLVLVADNEPDITELVRFQLERHGYDVLTAFDGAEALEKVHAHEPDLALIDVHMPRLDGYEVVQRIRADEELRPMPVIVLSASVKEEDVAASYEAGADKHLRKPFSPDELLSSVEELVRER